MTETLCGLFIVDADASPGLLSRLLQPYAKRDLTPDRLESHRIGDIMHVEIGMHAMPIEMIHLIEGNLGQIVGVRSVTRRARPVIRQTGCVNLKLSLKDDTPELYIASVKTCVQRRYRSQLQC